MTSGQPFKMGAEGIHDKRIYQLSMINGHLAFGAASL
jgi:hypothetical protein